MIRIEEYIPIAPYTVYKIGGPARYFIDARTADDVRDAVQFARERSVPFFILGGGSNILVSDEGFSGVVIHAGNQGIRVEGNVLEADAGAKMASAVAAASRASLAGFEWGIGIPGTVGGSLRGNAGCFGGEMKDVVSEVFFLDSDQAALPIKTFSNRACEFRYRHSIFKEHSEWIILLVRISLALGDPHRIKERILALSKERTEKQDIGTQSCGCIFKNISWEEAGDRGGALVNRFPELAGRPNIPASFLIDRAGLKGSREGSVVISPKHANFFVNEGGVRAGDVRSLIERAKARVKEEFDVLLHEEIQYVGFEKK